MNKQNVIIQPPLLYAMLDETRHIFIQHPETSIQHRLVGEGGVNGYNKMIKAMFSPTF